MSAGTVQITTDELLAMPDDGIERWIINGELREAGMTVRNTWHAETTSNVDYALRRWNSTQPRPRGKVYVGDAGVRLRRGPDTSVGVDLVYLSPSLAAQTPSGTRIIEVVPPLVVEVLSPSDKQEDIEEKIDAYLERGVPQIWTINPRRKTVTVFRPNQKPVMFNEDQELLGDPELPGFRVPVLSFFEDTDP